MNKNNYHIIKVNQLPDEIENLIHQGHVQEQKIYDWMYIKIILCWAWSLEDNSSITYWEKIINDII